MLFAWPKNCSSKCLWCAATFSYFLLQGKVLCQAHVGKSLARCLLPKAFGRRCRKNYISGYTLLRSFIQTVKCSLLDEKIVYQSFYGALLMFGYFLLQGKVLCFAYVCKSLKKCLFPKVSKKFYLRLYLAQIIHSNGKMLFAWLKNCLSNFLWCAATFSYFLLQGKVLCFARVASHLRDVYF